MRKPQKTVTAKVAEKEPVNTYATAIHIGDGRRIEPGSPIPSGVSADVVAALKATGHFK